MGNPMVTKVAPIKRTKRAQTARITGTLALTAASSGRKVPNISWISWGTRKELQRK